MFENERNGYKKAEVDHYLQRLDDDYKAIVKGHTERLENVKRNITELAVEIGQYTHIVIPKYKSEIESLRERLFNIRSWAEAASKIRYMKNTDIDAILANLIAQVLLETDNLDELKLVEPEEPTKTVDGEGFFEVLASCQNVKLEDALSGFDFYDNNPYKISAEKKLAKIEKKKKAEKKKKEREKK